MGRRGDNVNVIKLELPLQIGKGDPIETVAWGKDAIPREAVLDAYRILVVERKGTGNDMVSIRLRVSGARVDVAYTEKEGLELWNSYVAEPFDAVLVEGYLADMDYVSFAREFRGLKEIESVPLFVMVDEIRQESVSTSMLEGINAFLEKPLELKRIQQMLDAYYR